MALGALGGGIADRLAHGGLGRGHSTGHGSRGRQGLGNPRDAGAAANLDPESAAQGDIKAARQVLELDHAGRKLGGPGPRWNFCDLAIGHKDRYAPVFEQHEREGLDPPEIYPHPDDIMINDGLRGEVTIDGPESKEQAGARKAVREQALQSMLRYFEVEAALKKDRTNKALKREFKELKQYYEFLRRRLR